MVIVAKWLKFRSFTAVRKVSNTKNMDQSIKASDLDIRIDYLFCRIILKFLHFMENTIFRKNQKSAHRIMKFEYFTKILTYSKSPDHML